MDWWPIFVTMQGLSICIIICEIICERQFSGFVRLNHEHSLAGGSDVMSSSVCLYEYQVRIIVQNVHARQHRFICISTLCGRSVNISTSFDFRCLCRLKSTSPSSLSFPESVQKSMCYEIKKLPSGLSFQIYILLVFKYIFATTLWGSQQQLQVSGSYWQDFLIFSWIFLNCSLLARC